MKITKQPLSSTGAFSQMFIDYVEGRPELKSFYCLSPEIENFREAIENRKFEQPNRDTLVKVLTDQYVDLTQSEAVVKNIQSLSGSKTFTVTTGHQLNIFTGPLYFLFKIATTVNLAKRLKEADPDCDFVPVYWMASEDHDFDEISYFNLFGKKYQWQTDQKGPVGRFDPKGLKEVLDEMPEKVELFEKAYLEHETLADAVRYYANELFGEEGLIVVDADHADLKKEFVHVIEDDIFHQKANGLVEGTNQKLNEAGYKSQAFSRKINFFYLDGDRIRIVEEDGKFGLSDGSKDFEKDELKKEIHEHPDRFSPNVIMRPLYQEVILPNLAYIGGPAEIIYWLQLKDIFDHYQTDFPILMGRNFGMLINRASEKKMAKVGLSATDLFMTAHDLKAEYISRNSDNEHLLDDEKSELTRVFDNIKHKAGQIDKSLEGFIGAENAKAIKALENVEKRLKKAQETQNETALKQIDGLKEKLFPGGGLQERHDNFLNFYLNNPGFIQELLENFDPFDPSFYLFWDE